MIRANDFRSVGRAMLVVTGGHRFPASPMRSNGGRAMSLHVLATGSLIADPMHRSGQRSDFATGTVRVPTDDGAILVSVIGFGDRADDLLAHRQSDALSISGRATLRSWTKDGETKFGLSVVVEQIASASAVRRADAERRRSARAA